jgi:signal transduction histidine kinase
MCPSKATTDTARWARRYRAALRDHLAHRTGDDPRRVQALGREAVQLGLETLDLARAHQQALATLIAPGSSARSKQTTIKRAKAFFAEAAVRIEKTHSAAQVADDLIRQLEQRLQQRTQEASDSKRRLKHTIARRRGADAALKTSAKRHTRLLAESNRLLNHLRRLTHAGLAAQEEVRTKASRQLYDDIAQGLLGVHVRLLSLNRAVKASTACLDKEIGDTQRLVRESTRMVKRRIHERSPQDEA